MEGFGQGRIIGWNRDSVTAYSHLRTGKGRLNAWREKIGKAEFGYCKCGTIDTGNHVAFGCIQGESWDRRWSTWSRPGHETRCPGTLSRDYETRRPGNLWRKSRDVSRLRGKCPGTSRDFCEKFQCTDKVL